jgi:hypothetical protein
MKLKKHKTILKNILFILLLTNLIPFITADVYVGITHGHVYDTEGVPIQGAITTAQVSGCSLPECTGQDPSTEADGYYYIGNLAIPANHRVDASATLGTMFGSNFANSNENTLTEIDIIICDPPTIPILTPEPSTHDQFATVEWNSGIQPIAYGYPIFDQLELNGNEIEDQISTSDSASRDSDLTTLAFQTHTWRVRTCNTHCCSPWATDTFNVGNARPTIPILTEQPDTTPTTLDFEWISGTDDDGDETYDEYQHHIIDDPWGDSTLDAISGLQQNIVGCNYYEWRVRTCETASQTLCSSWATDGFIACGLECPACTQNCPASEGGTSSGTSSSTTTCTSKIQSLVITNPLTIEEDSPNPLKISFTTSRLSENIWFKIKSEEFAFNDYPLSALENSKAKFELIGKPKEGLEAGEYNLTVEITEEGKPTITEILPVTVTKSLVVRVKRIAKKASKWDILLWVLISLLLIISIMYFYYKYKFKKPKKQKPSKKLFSKTNKKI